MGCCGGKEDGANGIPAHGGAASKEPFAPNPVGPAASVASAQPSHPRAPPSQPHHQPPQPAEHRRQPASVHSQQQQRSTAPPVPVMRANFNMGEKVSARWSGDGHHYPGWIIGVRSDGTYKVQFEDGETDTVNYTHMRRRFGVGDRVDARWKGGAYYRGWIADTSNNGAYYAVAFDDGGHEPFEPLDHIRGACNPSPVTKGTLPAPGARQFVPPPSRAQDGGYDGGHSFRRH